MVRAPFSSTEDFHPMQSYRQGMAAMDKALPQFTQEHPKAAGMAESTGMAGGMLLPATKVARGASLVQKATAGAKTAGAYGALSGALSSKSDTVKGVLSDGFLSGETSAVVGGLLPVAGRFVGAFHAPFRPFTQPVVRMAGRALDRVGSVLPGSVGTFLSREGQQLARDPTQAAAHVQLDRAIRDSLHPVTGQSLRPADVPAEVGRRQEMGVPAVAGDLSDPLRQRLGTSAKTPGPATMRVRQILDGRRQQEAARTAQHIAASLGPVANVEAQATALNTQAKSAARPLYDLSDAQPIHVTHELQELFSRPVARQALNSAAVSLQNEGVPVLTDGLIQQADGTWRNGKVPTMKAYDYAKTALDDMVFAGSSPFKTPESARDTRGARAVRSRLLELMDGDGSGPPGSRTPLEGAAPGTEVGPWTEGHSEPNARANRESSSAIPPEGLNPYWRPAREAYAGPIQNRKALELGEEMARSGATDVANRVEALTPSQTDHFRLGHRSALASDMRARPDYSDAARRVAGSEDQRQAIAAVHGPEAAAALSDRLGAEGDAAETWKAVRGGPSANDGSFLAQDQRIEAGARGILQTLVGHPGPGLGNIARALVNGERGGQEVNGHIAQILAEQDPAALSAAMDNVEAERARRARVEQRKGEAFQRTSRLLGSVFGTNIIEPVTDGEPTY